MKHDTNYTDDNIESLDILSHIRLRPNAYIMDLGQIGQFHVIKEILDNSIDELENCQYKNLFLNIYLIFDKKKKEYLYAIEDNGRGIPLKKLKDTFTKQFTSGKFNQDVYQTSGGLLGIGAKASVSLSSISKIFSFRENKVKEINIRYNENKFLIDEFPIKKFKNISHGTFSIFKLDKNIFSDIDKWIFGGYEILVDYIKKLSIFTDGYKINLFILDNPDLVRNIKILDFNLIKNKLKESDVISSFDSRTFNKKEYIENVFHIEIEKTKEISILDSVDKLNVNMSLFFDITNENYRTIISGTNKITFVNNILINDNESYHIRILKKYIKKCISMKISDKNVREFFSKQYILPIFYLIHINFSGAQFVGTTKHAFKDNSFSKPYLSLLKKHISNTMISKIYEYIEKHIIVQYNKFGNDSFIIKNNRKLLLELERPTKFDDCLSKDKDKSELFLVEGESARSTDGRDEVYQALYTLGGKTLNSLLQMDKEDLSLQKIKSNAIFRDIIKILNIVPGSNDLTNLRFNKILIMSDADDHGYHIASILIGNFMIVSKKLIEEGHISVIVSPLYNVKVPNVKEMLYLKSNDELISLLIKNVYNKEFRLYSKDTGKRLPNSSLINIISMIMEIGNIFKNISDEIKIPGSLIEALYKISKILSKDKLLNSDLNKIKESLNNKEIFYEKEDHILIISIGIVDHIIPLNIFKDIQKRLENLLKDINLSDYDFLISFKKENFAVKYDYSINEIYSLLLRLKNRLVILRNKGLGSLNVLDKQITCLNSDTRITKEITSIGDLDVIYGLLGNNSDYRKQKLTETI